jgi:hypothetical protein
MLFDVTSRYHEIGTAELTTPEGRKIVYLRRRFVPSVPVTVELAEHKVTQGERLDNITARYLGDPEQFWQVADANNAMHPDELIEINRRLHIPLPEGGI